MQTSMLRTPAVSSRAVIARSPAQPRRAPVRVSAMADAKDDKQESTVRVDHLAACSSFAAFQNTIG